MEILSLVYANKNNENELIIKGNGNSGFVLTIFDPTGSHGASNFLKTHKNFEFEIDSSIGSFIEKLIYLANNTNGQFNIKNVSYHYNVEFYILNSVNIYE